jgi:hypothetical protein
MTAHVAEQSFHEAGPKLFACYKKMKPITGAECT